MSSPTNNKNITVCTTGDVSNQNECVKIRCDECNLPFWSREQLQKHSKTHTRKKKLICSHCTKKFSRSDHLKMHTRSCDKNPLKNNVERKSTTTLQVGRGVKGDFKLIQSAFKGVLQEWRYNFSESEDIYESLDLALTKDARELVIEATGLFKWYLSLKYRKNIINFKFLFHFLFKLSRLTLD